MPTTRARTRQKVSTSTATLITLLSVALSGCGSTDRSGGSTSASSSPTTSPSATSSAPNAGWHEATEDGGSLLVPPDWAVEDGPTGINLQAPRTREGGARLGGGILASRATIESSDAIDDAGKTALAFHKNGMDKAERLPDVTLGGVKFYHVRGEDSKQWLDDFGTVKDGKLITVLWTFHRGFVDRKQTDELITPVMETFEPTS